MNFRGLRLGLPVCEDIWTPEVPECLRGRERALSEMLVDTLAELHAIDPETADLSSLGRPEGFLSRTVEGWLKRAEVASGGTPPAAVEELGEWLEEKFEDID